MKDQQKEECKNQQQKKDYYKIHIFNPNIKFIHLPNYYNLIYNNYEL